MDTEAFRDHRRPVVRKAYIAALPGWNKAVAMRVDALIEREVPDVRRAIKWNMPFYGIEGQGWFVAFAAFSKHVKLMFFRGTSRSVLSSLLSSRAR